MNRAAVAAVALGAVAFGCTGDQPEPGARSRRPCPAPAREGLIRCLVWPTELDLARKDLEVAIGRTEAAQAAAEAGRPFREVSYWSSTLQGFVRAAPATTWMCARVFQVPPDVEAELDRAWQRIAVLAGPLIGGTTYEPFAPEHADRARELIAAFDDYEQRMRSARGHHHDCHSVRIETAMEGFCTWWLGRARRLEAAAAAVATAEPAPEAWAALSATLRDIDFTFNEELRMCAGIHDRYHAWRESASDVDRRFDPFAPVQIDYWYGQPLPDAAHIQTLHRNAQDIYEAGRFWLGYAD